MPTKVKKAIKRPARKVIIKKTPKKLQVPLPDLPSEMVKDAIKEVRLLEKNPKYIINMGEWHQKLGGKCEVCLAGSMIAKCYPPTKSINFQEFCELTKRKLGAINCFREGRLYNGLDELEIDCPDDMPMTIEVCEYSDNRTKFFKDMGEVVKALEAVGL